MDIQPARRALVTGGALGLGYGVAERLLQSGAQVLIGDISKPALESARQSLNSPRLETIPLDVTNPRSVSAAVEKCRAKFGGLDTLVNCAGVFAFLKLEETSEEEWDRLIDVNLKGVFLCCQAAAPLLSESGRGRIVNLSSDAGKKGYPLISAYCTSKFGVIGFSKAIAGELAPRGVTVNCVCPIGVTTTGMGQQILGWLVKNTGQTAEDILAQRAKSVPMGRMAAVSDVVHAVMYFLSDGAAFITGEALNVDGGVLGTGVVPGIER